MENQSEESLKFEIVRLQKINAALMGRVERSTSPDNSAFAHFAGDLLLSKEVQKRTKSLKESAKALANEKYKLAKVMGSLPGAILLFDQDFNIIEHYLNNFPEGMLSHIFFSDKQHFLPKFERLVGEKVKEFAQGNGGHLFSCEYTAGDQDFYINCSLAEIADGKYTLFLMDDTQRSRQQKIIAEQESHLAQLSKLSSLGEMAGNIAHEINTPLGTIMMLASIIEKKAVQLRSVEIETHAVRINATIDGISKIIQSLKQMGRNANLDEYESVNLQDILDGAIQLCQYKYKQCNIKIIQEGLRDVPITVRRVQITQVLVNLLNNAHHAVQNLDDPWVKIKVDLDLDTLQLRIIDAGNGIDQAIVDRIFERFYTTKNDSEGTGLGMSLSRQIVEEHGGRLEYQPFEGHTGFLIELKCGERSQLLDQCG